MVAFCNRSHGPLLQGIQMVTRAPRASPNCPGVRPGRSVCAGRDLDDVVRRGLLLARGAHAGKPGLLAQGAERPGSQVAHPALHAADQVRQDVVDGAADLLQRLDSLGRDLAGVAPGPCRSARRCRPSSRRANPSRGTACRPFRRFP